jgi:hypothetical protein
MWNAFCNDPLLFKKTLNDIIKKTFIIGPLNNEIYEFRLHRHLYNKFCIYNVSTPMSFSRNALTSSFSYGLYNFEKPCSSRLTNSIFFIPAYLTTSGLWVVTRTCFLCLSETSFIILIILEIKYGWIFRSGSSIIIGSPPKYRAMTSAVTLIVPSDNKCAGMYFLLEYVSAKLVINDLSPVSLTVTPSINGRRSFISDY